jgi:hypothetical protein
MENANQFSNINITRIVPSVFPAILTCVRHLELLARQLTTPLLKELNVII